MPRQCPTFLKRSPKRTLEQIIAERKQKDALQERQDLYCLTFTHAADQPAAVALLKKLCTGQTWDIDRRSGRLVVARQCLDHLKGFPFTKEKVVTRHQLFASLCRKFRQHNELTNHRGRSTAHELIWQQLCETEYFLQRIISKAVRRTWLAALNYQLQRS